VAEITTASSGTARCEAKSAVAVLSRPAPHRLRAWHPDEPHSVTCSGPEGTFVDAVAPFAAGASLQAGAADDPPRRPPPALRSTVLTARHRTLLGLHRLGDNRGEAAASLPVRAEQGRMRNAS